MCGAHCAPRRGKTGKHCIPERKAVLKFITNPPIMTMLAIVMMMMIRITTIAMISETTHWGRIFPIPWGKSCNCCPPCLRMNFKWHINYVLLYTKFLVQCTSTPMESICLVWIFYFQNNLTNLVLWAASWNHGCEEKKLKKKINSIFISLAPRWQLSLIGLVWSGCLLIVSISQL